MKSDRRRARGLLIACEPGNETEEGLLITHQRGVTYSLPSGARSPFRFCWQGLQDAAAGRSEAGGGWGGSPVADAPADRSARSAWPCSKQTGYVYRQSEEGP